MRIGIMVLLSVWAISAQAVIYKSYDANGRVIFSDEPFDEHSETVDLPAPNIVPKLAEPEKKLAFEAKEGEVFAYESLEVTSPTNEQVIFNPEQVSLQAKLGPPLQTKAGHEAQLLWNNRIVSNNLSHVIDVPDRGTHTVFARVVDEKGNVLISSDIVYVYIKRNSILLNRNNSARAAP